jgi:hypothetical protein
VTFVLFIPPLGRPSSLALWGFIFGGFTAFGRF